MFKSIWTLTSLVIFEVILSVVDEGLHDLRGHKLCTSNWCEQQRRCIGAATRMELNPRAEVKVAQLDRGEPVAVHAKHILGLEVPVRNPFRVEELESRGNVRDDPCRLLLREKLPENRSVNCGLGEIVKLSLTFSGCDPAAGHQKPSRKSSRTGRVLRSTQLTG